MTASVAPLLHLNALSGGVLEQNMRPWPGVSDTKAAETVGTYFKLQNPLDDGTKDASRKEDFESVIAWKWTGPATNTDERYRYWCHGHSLQTRDATNARYSISSTSMHLVLLNPKLFQTIQEPCSDHVLAQNNTVQAGDIIAFFECKLTGIPGQPASAKVKRIYCTHTARIVSPVVQASPINIPGYGDVLVLDETRTTVSSKNGSDALKDVCPLKAVQRVYSTATTFAVFRAGQATNHQGETINKINNAAQKLELIVNRKMK